MFYHNGKRLGAASIPRAFRITEVPSDVAQSLPHIRQQLIEAKDAPLPLGLTVLKVGFSSDFAVPAITVLTTSEFHLTSAAEVPTPIVLCVGRFELLATLRDPLGPIDHGEQEAKEMLEGGASGRELRDRIRWLESMKVSKRFCSTPGPIYHGTSIGLAVGPESKGSAGLYVTPTTSANGFIAKRNYLLTAAHVVLPGGFPERMDVPFDDSVTIVPVADITTPGRLDVARVLFDLQNYWFLNSVKAKELVVAAKTPCGTVMTGKIGCDPQGWREDWALISLEDVFRGKNGLFRDLEGFGDISKGVQDIAADGEVEGGVDLCHDRTWYKDGASTGWTAGEVSQQELELFLKSTAGEDYHGAVHEKNVVRARLVLLQAADGASMAAAGDSGSALFSLSDGGRKFVWGGMIVSLFRPSLGQEFVMAVPQSQILEQLALRTGVRWEL
ncbi:hypothetical protein FN846DRAFT_892982 [Sphaerosporella brunnea]|uniref:Peptidase S1 domain-containing protein n=1 Tax=Sphaerosporella brunnea TaxID=1250544 RepID=A0A5J5ENT2_9PEZI|nr:hypothetical protein FN846DRAFT_892982 [Sphaerosporella brunnea]